MMSFDPRSGWSAPVLQPYQPLQIDPAASCFQYSTNLFEGMKAYLGPDGEPRLFRPSLNMERMKASAARLALPVSWLHPTGYTVYADRLSRYTDFRLRRALETNKEVGSCGEALDTFASGV